jgi:dephospho-CoA kinase
MNTGTATAARRPYIVGLTGGIGSGKSAATARFAARGATVVDTDAIAHALTAAGGAAMPAIRDAFGAGVVAADGSLDRAAMRALAFSQPAARERLESILHPMIRAQSAHQCAAAPAPYVILAVPLLIESGSYRERCDRICVVDCPEALQIERVRARSGLDESQIRAIMGAQASRAERLAAADDVIDNSGTLAALDARVDALDALYRAAARV